MSWESLVNRHKDSKSELQEIDRIFASVFSDADGKKILEFFEIYFFEKIVPKKEDA